MLKIGGGVSDSGWSQGKTGRRGAFGTFPQVAIVDKTRTEAMRMTKRVFAVNPPHAACQGFGNGLSHISALVLVNAFDPGQKAVVGVEVPCVAQS